jgi:hypothetical protein
VHFLFTFSEQNHAAACRVKKVKILTLQVTIFESRIEKKKIKFIRVSQMQ